MSVEADPRTRWWHKEVDNKVVCTLCPRECHIPEGSRGFCFVRANVDGQLVLTTYGRSSGFCIDPIEKKPLNHFLPGTPVLSFGTAGCNLGCKFCQNWDISKSRETDRVADEATPEAIIDAAEQTGCRSVAFTYNDPVIFAEYAIDIAKVARQRGIKTVAVTAGYINPEARREFYQWMDAANVDLKAFTETFYRKLTQTHLDPVLDTLKYLKHETDVWFELTNLMIPGENDSPQETENMCKWIVDNLGDQVPIHFTTFHPDFKMMDKPPTPAKTLQRAREQALEAGIKYVYIGNVYDVKRQSTYCPQCHTLLIERDWHELGEYHMNGNHCGQCGTVIPGVFETGRGNWGRRRLPIRIEADPTNNLVKISAKKTWKRKGKSSPTAKPPNPNHGRPQTSNPESGASIAIAAPEQALAVPASPAPPKTEFTDEEARVLLAFVRRVIEQSVCGDRISVTLPPALDQASAYGAFVTLKRVTLLRGCRGRWGEAVGDGQQSRSTLGPLLENVARDTALADPRFAAIRQRELPLLTLDVSIMYDANTMTAKGLDRLHAVDVGTHGLVIHHPHGRGLLLPQVATESNWDAATFLRQVCLKAELPDDAWQQEHSTLMTFRAAVLADEAPEAELDPRCLNSGHIQRLVTAANQMLRDQLFQGLFDDEVLAQRRQEKLGIHLQTKSGITAAALGANHSLLELVQIAVQSLKQICTQQNKPPQNAKSLSLLWQPIRLRPQDYPQRHRTLVSQAVLAEGPQSAWALVLPTKQGATNRVADALAALNTTVQKWQDDQVRLTAFSVRRFDVRHGPTGQTTRRAARAGQFYPADPPTMVNAIEKYLTVSDQADKVEPIACRAVMLPHAGWTFCGNTIGMTIRRVQVPGTVIVVGPKHTPHGAMWSIPPHTQWDIPGSRIPIATDMAQRLLRAVGAFQCEPEAHRIEHGTEVLLPFLQRLNPDLRVLPVVIGGNRCYDALEPLADALAAIYRESDHQPLLIISSDMNHFATEAENRRLDHLALDAMNSGDPRRLYDTVTQHQISMCGVLPAVVVMWALTKLGSRLEPELVDYRTSAAATGDSTRVVGYAGVLIR